MDFNGQLPEQISKALERDQQKFQSKEFEECYFGYLIKTKEIKARYNESSNFLQGFKDLAEFEDAFNT